MPYSMVIDGKVHDVIFRKRGDFSYAVYITRYGSNILIGTVHNVNEFGWSAAIAGYTHNLVPIVSGFTSRWKAREYLVEAYELSHEVNN